jgi:hypothetical protein
MQQFMDEYLEGAQRSNVNIQITDRKNVGKMTPPDQCCQMVYFETKNLNFSKALECKSLVYSVAIWNIFGTFYVYVVI